VLKLSPKKFRAESGTKFWWQLLEDDLEVFIDSNGEEPTDDQITMAQESLDKIEVISAQALDYIDVWVDRTREGTGTENWLSALFILPSTRRGGQTKIQFGFTDDQDSKWWVLFNNPVPPFPGGKPRYHPIAFGREQG
jgi:hypothetical protein